MRSEITTAQYSELTEAFTVPLPWLHNPLNVLLFDYGKCSGDFNQYFSHR